MSNFSKIFWVNSSNGISSYMWIPLLFPPTYSHCPSFFFWQVCLPRKCNSISYLWGPSTFSNEVQISYCWTNNYAYSMSSEKFFHLTIGNVPIWISTTSILWPISIAQTKCEAYFFIPLTWRQQVIKKKYIKWKVERQMRQAKWGCC